MFWSGSIFAIIRFIAIETLVLYLNVAGVVKFLCQILNLRTTDRNKFQISDLCSLERV